jgi:hypothetical protein
MAKHYVTTQSLWYCETCGTVSTRRYLKCPVCDQLNRATEGIDVFPPEYDPEEPHMTNNAAARVLNALCVGDDQHIKEAIAVAVHVLTSNQVEQLALRDMSIANISEQNGKLKHDLERTVAELSAVKICREEFAVKLREQREYITLLKKRGSLLQHIINALRTEKGEKLAVATSDTPITSYHAIAAEKWRETQDANLKFFDEGVMCDFEHSHQEIAKIRPKP